MKKPTIDEVREYFKLAIKVRHLSTSGKGRVHDFKVERKGFHIWREGNWWCDIEHDSVCVWREGEGFAEIVETLETKTNMRKLSREDYQSIYGVACTSWKVRLQEWFGSQFALTDVISIPEAKYKLMRKACDENQNKLFDKIFGEDNKYTEQYLEKGEWYLLLM